MKLPCDRSTESVTRLNRRTVVGLLGSAAAVGMSGLQAAAAPAPKRGGLLRMGISGASTTDSLDPATYSSTYMQCLGLQIFDTLTEISPAGEVLPALCESWSASSNASQWNLKIRSGVQFHNGRELSASDVVFSLDHHRKKDSTSGAKSYFSDITDIKTVSPREVQISMTNGNADLPYLLADYHLCIMQSGESTASGMGTGPYVLGRFQPGVTAATTRNKNYWRNDRGWVDAVETTAINDDSARISALLSGSVDLINRADPKVANRLESNPMIRLHSISGGGHYYFVMRCDTPPFDNLDVRLALKYAIDRNEQMSKILNGRGKVGYDNPIPSMSPFFADDIDRHDFDPDKARFHAKKGGLDTPIELTLANVAFPGAIDAGILFKEQAAKSGIAINVKQVPDDGYWSETWMKAAFCGSYSGGRVTPDLVFSLNYKSDAAWNETFWKRPHFDEVLIQARTELDQGKRKGLYRELQQMVVTDGGVIIPMFNNFLDVGSNRLEGFVPNPYIEMSGGRAAASVWFAD